MRGASQTGWYAVPTDSRLGFALYREYRLAAMRAQMEGVHVRYLTKADAQLLLDRWATASRPESVVAT